MGDGAFVPEEHAECFQSRCADGILQIVCDTNVYLNAREAVGVEVDGQLRIPIGQANESPDLAVLRADAVAGISTTFVVALAVRNELFALIRGGYNDRPVGLEDAGRTAKALRQLLDLHPRDRWTLGVSTAEEELPDPPLSPAEKNDRQIWGEARSSGALLVTSDTKLLEAVRLVCRDDCRALRPAELHSLALALLSEGVP